MSVIAVSNITALTHDCQKCHYTVTHVTTVTVVRLVFDCIVSLGFMRNRTAGSEECQESTNWLRKECVIAVSNVTAVICVTNITIYVYCHSCHYSLPLYILSLVSPLSLLSLMVCTYIYLYTLNHT